MRLILSQNPPRESRWPTPRDCPIKLNTRDQVTTEFTAAAETLEEP